MNNTKEKGEEQYLPLILIFCPVAARYGTSDRTSFLILYHLLPIIKRTVYGLRRGDQLTSLRFSH